MPMLKYAQGLRVMTPTGDAVVQTVLGDYRGRPGISVAYPDGSIKKLWQRNCAVIKGQPLSEEILAAESQALLDWRVEYKAAESAGSDLPMHPSIRQAPSVVAGTENSAEVMEEAQEQDQEALGLSGVASMKVADAIEQVSASSDIDALASAFVAEEEGKNRKSVKAAIEAQMSGLSDLH